MRTSSMVAAVATVALLTVFTVEGRVVLHHQAKTDQLNLRIATPLNDEVHLTLTKATEEESSSLSNIPTFVSGKLGKIVRWQEPTGYSLKTYTDASSQASVVIETTVDSEGRTTQRYRGSFVDGNQVYWLAPLMTRSSSVDERSDRFQPLEGSVTVRIGDVDHLVAPAKFDSSGEYDNVISSAKLHEKSYSHRYDGRDKVTYVVELLIAGDYSLYHYWYKTYSSFKDPFMRQNEAILLLRHYFAGVADQIDKRYRSMKQPDFDINVKLVGFFFAQNAADSQFTEGSDVKTEYYGVSYVHMGRCLQKFGKWVSENSQFYGAFDHAVLFVGNYLYDKIEDGVPSTKSGLANVGGVCKISEGLCTSVNYERGFYSTSQTGAHELAHNLGAAHDEENNECKGSDQYVMAAAPGVLTHDIYTHPYTFSQCSIRYFRDFLGKLTSEGKNCLLTTDSTVEVLLVAQLPGVIQDVDQQCFNYQGTNSFYCAGMIHDEELCEKIVCWDTDTLRCTWESAEHRAYAGTPCGNKKWCFMGVCTADDKALVMNDTCIYGDYKGEMYISEDHQKVKCDEMVTKFPEQCYSEDKLKRCCDACPSIRNNDKPDCEYGDRVPARCLTGKRDNCYDENFNRDCCDWCEKQLGDDKTCRFGDRAEWCSTITSDKCYGSHVTCCESCKKFLTVSVNSLNEGCEYGDKVPWCASQEHNAKNCQPGTEHSQQCCGSCAKKFPNGITPNAENPSEDKPQTGGTAKCPDGDKAGYCSEMIKNPSKCYNAEDVCCATCEKLNSNIKGCAYGDQSDDCIGLVDHEYCQVAEVFQLCCKSCLSLQRKHNLDLLETLLSKVD